MPTYSVRCLFRLSASANQRLKHLYAERLTLWQAASSEAAIDLAEQEAETYANHGAPASAEFLGLAQACELIAPLAGHGVEIFSMIRESDLEPEDYLDAFFDTGTERERIYGEDTGHSQA